MKWLIRTKTLNIIGPMSKEDLLKYLSQNQLHDDDEICEGNGHWFFFREKNLVNKLLFNDVVPKEPEIITNINSQKDGIKNLTSNLLKFLLMVLFIFLIILLYYRKRIYRNFLLKQSESTLEKII